MVNSHQEMTNILGLYDYPDSSLFKNEGWEEESALDSLRKRYNQLNACTNSPLNVHQISFFSNPATHYDDLINHGDAASFISTWSTINAQTLFNFSAISRHSYTIHAVKDGDMIHFIYVNRGQRHYDLKTGKDKSSPSVMVFSKDTREASEFAQELFSANLTFNSRKSMSIFLEKHENSRNIYLTELLSKKESESWKLWCGKL